MAHKVLTIFALLSLILPSATAGRYWSRRHHQEVAHRVRGDVDIHKRQSYSNARFTFYDVGLGACGQYSAASDFIVALNVEQYGNGYPGPMCFKSITIQYGGKTAQATIMDECMGCPWGALDFSRGLFDFFADEGVGVLYGTWWLNDGSSGGGVQSTSSQWTPPTTTWEQPSSTSTPEWTPTTSSAPDYTPSPTTSSTPDYTPSPTTSSTPNYTPSTTSSTSTSTTTSATSSSFAPSTVPASSINFSSGVLSGLAAPTGVVVPAPGASDPQNLVVINNILVDVGVVLTAAEKSA